MAYLNHNLPSTRCFIRNEYLFNHTKGHGEVTPCDIHTVTSIQGLTPLFEAFLENGVNWTRRPITAFCWKENAPVYPLTTHVYWDSFSNYVDVSIRQRLSGLRADLMTPNKELMSGTYMFTIDWGFENNGGMLDVSFSQTSEHKCGHFFKMDDGNFFAYPNNKIIWRDKAWTFNLIKENPGYIIDESVYYVEGEGIYQTDHNFLTNFEKIT